ncbi:hypothetical protein [Azospirillum sp. SYSU D00513]|uniref:hypothetical protein n=1 Tax=Azospirillum sp. SYSU D00513 TaxID=2812561 RepID=UPI001A969041|nr:hypothetical protein [Azospirillum sp. SYSU D00513]
MIGGSTPSEQYLSKLCEKSFLSLWSYSNPYTDRGIKNGVGEGKELCDLLVVFGNNVIIFSDKSCSMKNTGSLSVDWNRWYRRSIHKSVDQIYGAERWMIEFPDRIFLDKKASVPFPFDLRSINNIRFHRVAVALGAADRARSELGGGSGSLRLTNISDSDMANDADFVKAFAFNGSNPKGFVHVFDDITLDILLSELNTISDFCSYLSEKEDFFASNFVAAAKEEDLLAIYLMSKNSLRQHYSRADNELKEAHIIFDGLWNRFSSSQKYTGKKSANLISYRWDSLIETFSKVVIDHAKRTGARYGEYEEGLRLMASLSRLERRMVSGYIEAKLSVRTPSGFHPGAYGFPDNAGLVFVFAFCEGPQPIDPQTYIKARRVLLAKYAAVVRYRQPSTKKVLGLILQSTGRGAELGLYTFENWNESNEKQARKDIRELGIDLWSRNVFESDYPGEYANVPKTKAAQRRLKKRNRRKK